MREILAVAGGEGAQMTQGPTSSSDSAGDPMSLDLTSGDPMSLDRTSGDPMSLDRTSGDPISVSYEQPRSAGNPPEESVASNPIEGGRAWSSKTKDFDSKLRIQSNSFNGSTAGGGGGGGGAGGGGGGGGAVQRSKSSAIRAPQENLTIQDFELGKTYGVGSYSKVVRARKKDNGIVYALKIMDKKFIEKINKKAYVARECFALYQLDHPGIVQLFFIFQDTCSQYMALESCEGGELFDQITRKGRLSENEARFYAAEVVDALEYIHSEGFIHRNIKPESLLLTADGHIKIADVGGVKYMQDNVIAVLLNAAPDDQACTDVRTAAYVPPEVLNSSPATLGNDLWALGCTLYEMLSGTSPFKDATEWLIYQRIRARDIRFRNYFSNEARDLIDQLLATEPSSRPGAGRDGYASLKMHPFFNGVDWNNLRSQTPPKLI